MNAEWNALEEQYWAFRRRFSRLLTLERAAKMLKKRVAKTPIQSHIDQLQIGDEWYDYTLVYWQPIIARHGYMDSPLAPIAGRRKWIFYERMSNGQRFLRSTGVEHARFYDPRIRASDVVRQAESIEALFDNRATASPIPWRERLKYAIRPMKVRVSRAWTAGVVRLSALIPRRRPVSNFDVLRKPDGALIMQINPDGEVVWGTGMGVSDLREASAYQPEHAKCVIAYVIDSLTPQSPEPGGWSADVDPAEETIAVPPVVQEVSVSGATKLD